jgi:hypothetical protein
MILGLNYTLPIFRASAEWSSEILQQSNFYIVPAPKAVSASIMNCCGSLKSFIKC